MEKRSLFGAVIGASIATSVIRGMKRKKVKEAPRTDPGKLQDAEVISPTNNVHETVQRKCPACGNVDTSGSDQCPVCYANLNPNASSGDI